MLMKMGWAGSGLGAQGQGIETPISGGEVRDKQDQFKVMTNLNRWTFEDDKFIFFLRVLVST